MARATRNINSGHTTDNFAFQAWQYFTQNGGLSSLFWLPLQCAELASWSWTAGIVIGTLARQTTRLNAIQVVLQTCLVMIPTIAGVRQSTGSTITILRAATLVLMPIHHLVGPFQIVHHNLDLACYLMVWPVLYWLATPLLRKRVTL